jgi:hypothetical protein
MKRTSSALVLSFFFVIFLLCGRAAFGIGTVAGTSIEAGIAEVYHDNRVDYSNAVTVMVSQDYGLEFSTAQVAGTVIPGGSYYFPHTLTNVGNGSDIFTFELSNTTDNWSSTLVRDDNMNGIHEDSEITPVPNQVLLAEDANYYLFTVLSAPQYVAEQVTGTTTLRVSGSTDDGGTYLGANGAFYGGPDSAVSAVSAQVTHIDNTPPTISDLIINGRRRFAQDIVSSRLRIEATILDNEPRNVERIEIWMNDSLEYQGTSADWQNAYDEDSGFFEVELSPLEAGEYTFKIIVWDRAGNQAEEIIEPLYIYPPSDIRVIGPPVNYPNPFAPLKGEQTAIAYVLTTDVDITIYIFDITGTTVWRRTFEAFEEGGKAGYNEVIWNGYSDFGKVLGNGIYIFKIVHKKNVIGDGKSTILDSR